jgi:L-iditol 2-dehydrogenase
MRRAVLAAPGEVRIEDDVLLPEPGPREIRVRAQSVGICGSDLHALAGQHPFVDLPVVPGHEVAGVVDALGAGVSELAVGERVLLEPNLIDGTCVYCRNGRYNLCEHLLVVGCTTSGAMAQQSASTACPTG